MRSERPVRSRLAFLFCLLVLAGGAVSRAGDFPEPSPYPVAWELKFDHSKPKRIVVTIPGQGQRAFWYVTYSVTNESGEDQTFLPVFEMVTRDGKILRSDKNVPFHAFEEIKRREGNRSLLSNAKIGGVLRVGEDQARDGVAIWPEPMAEMGSFSIYVGGLSGETVTLKMVDGKSVRVKPENTSQELKGVKDEDIVILRKTLQLNHVVYGDDRFPTLDEVNTRPEQWVMR